MEEEKETIPEETEENEEAGEEDMDTEELAEHADDKVDALINLLIKKGVITEEEINNEYNDMFEDDDSTETEE